MSLQPQPSPLYIYECFGAYQRTAALKAAIELDVFTAIREGADTAAALAEVRNTSERGMRILCDYLTIIKLLEKDGKVYRLAPESAMFLDRASPSYIGGAARFLLSPMLTANFNDLAAAVVKGGVSVSELGTLAPEHPVWVEFAKGMAPLAALNATFIADLLEADRGEPWQVLDVAAGHGLFGITIAKRNPNAFVVAVDWPNVLTVARENAEAAGVAERFSTLAGSAFDVEFGDGYDLALLTNFLHHFDENTCQRLIAKVARALKPGGRCVTLEYVPNEDRVTPPVSAGFSLVMLGTTPSGDAYTFSQYEGMFRRAGFSKDELYESPLTPQQVIVSQK